MSDKDTVPQAWMTKKANKYIKQIVTAETKKKIKKGKGKRRYSSSSLESSGSEEKSRRSGMSGAEQNHMLASAGINLNNSDIEFPSNDEKRYRKQAKEWTKSKGKRRRR